MRNAGVDTRGSGVAAVHRPHATVGQQTVDGPLCFMLQRQAFGTDPLEQRFQPRSRCAELGNQPAQVTFCVVHALRGEQGSCPLDLLTSIRRDFREASS
jgi:hypothetical protein